MTKYFGTLVLILNVCLTSYAFASGETCPSGSTVSPAGNQQRVKCEETVSDATTFNTEFERVGFGFRCTLVCDCTFERTPKPLASCNQATGEFPKSEVDCGTRPVQVYKKTLNTSLFQNQVGCEQRVADSQSSDQNENHCDNLCSKVLKGPTTYVSQCCQIQSSENPTNDTPIDEEPVSYEDDPEAPAEEASETALDDLF